MALHSGNTLAAGLDAKQNNFDLVRLVAAWGVLVSHSFPLSTGRGVEEPLQGFSRHQFTLGGLCVGVFLVISGLLVTKSYERSRSLPMFLRARVLRIFPGLSAALLGSSLGIGLVVTSLSAGDYLSQPATYSYVLRNLSLFFPQNELPGVFTTNIYAPSVNGSLWTLAYEVLFYFVVAALGVSRSLNRWTALLLWAASFAWPVLKGAPSDTANLFHFFGAGMVLYLWRDRIRTNLVLALSSVVVIVALMPLGQGAHVLLSTLGAWALVVLCLAPLGLPSVEPIGDLSYGTYVWAWPVQQTITWAIGPTSWWVNALLATPLVFLIASASWRLVERPALRWKKIGAPASAPVTG